VGSGITQRPVRAGAGECLAGWEEDFDDRAYTTFVAEFDGVVIGSSIGCSLELSSSPSGQTAGHSVRSEF
jgi:hypothetical protein